MTKHALYRFYSDSGQLLYTGITSDPERRFTEHSKEKYWWTHVRGITVDWYEDRESVLSAEKRIIRIENPQHNIRDKRESLRGQDELSYEDHVHMAAAMAAAEEQETSREFFRSVAEHVDAALGQGYSHREIVEAAEATNWIADSTLADHLPVYPGLMWTQVIDDLNDAHIYLASFVPSEVEQFLAQARAEPEMARAHAHEITIRSSQIAKEFMSTHERDLELLSAFLTASASGREHLEWAQRRSGRGALFPLPIDCREVIENAVASLLGTWTPDDAPTTELRWRELASLRR